MDFLLQILAFISTVLILVSFHEAGHFVVAKMLGIRVLRFSVGFGKKIFRYRDKSGTEYVLALIPLGGYVKLLDEREVVVPPSEKPFSFNAQPLWARTLVVLAGPLTNIVFAILGFWLMFMVGIDSLRPIIGEVLPNSIAQQAGLKAGEEIRAVDGSPTPSLQKVLMALVKRLGEQGDMLIEAGNPANQQYQRYQLPLANWRVNELRPDPLTSLGIRPLQPQVPAVVGEVSKNEPAALAGLQPNDVILAVNQQPIKDWLQFLKFIQQHPNQQAQLQFQRNGQVNNVVLNISSTHLFKKIGYVGIKPKLIDIPKKYVLARQYPPLSALFIASQETWELFVFNAVIFKKMIMGQISLSSLGGPITIFESANAAFKQGVSVFLAFLSLISVMLAFVNLLPIPGLDGGHLLNFLIEFIIRRPLSLKYEIISIQVGMFVLIVIMLLATFNDVLRLMFAS